MARFDLGYVKIYRKAVLGDIGSSFIRQGLFDCLVAIANRFESVVDWNCSPRTIKRGELVTSFMELSDLGNVDRKTIKRHLEYLRQRETIIYEIGHGSLFIKLVNYEKYQPHNAEGSNISPNSIPTQSNMSPISVPHNGEIQELKEIREVELVGEKTPPPISNVLTISKTLEHYVRHNAHYLKFKNLIYLDLKEKIKADDDLEREFPSLFLKYKTPQGLSDFLNSLTMSKKYKESPDDDQKRQYIRGALFNKAKEFKGEGLFTLARLNEVVAEIAPKVEVAVGN